MAYGLDIVLSDLGEISLAHNAFFAGGAYAAALLAVDWGMNAWATLAGAILVGPVDGARPRRHYPADARVRILTGNVRRVGRLLRRRFELGRARRLGRGGRHSDAGSVGGTIGLDRWKQPRAMAFCLCPAAAHALRRASISTLQIGAGGVDGPYEPAPRRHERARRAAGPSRRFRRVGTGQRGRGLAVCVSTRLCRT